MKLWCSLLQRITLFIWLTNTPPNRSSVSWAPNCGPKALIPNPNHGSNSQMMDLPVPLRSWA